MQKDTSVLYYAMTYMN